MQVIAAPAGPQGGVIYVFEDITQQLVVLQSQHRSLLDAQRSTINALSEAVAVFGTNGRLTSPIRASAFCGRCRSTCSTTARISIRSPLSWPVNFRRTARRSGHLKRKIIDLNPNRADQQGRIGRADGKLIDYAVTRLPDGQRMITFLDVSESANYQRVLTERNEALVTADRLKDAFVQNVSYEFRSPLTNIIGFAELLASETAGPLNERQKSYTEYIGALSETLGLLIDFSPRPADRRCRHRRAASRAAGRAHAGQPRDRLGSPRPSPRSMARRRSIWSSTWPTISRCWWPMAPVSCRFSTTCCRHRPAIPSPAARCGDARARGEHMTFVVEDEGAPLTGEARAALLDRDSASNGRDRGAGLALAIVRAFVNMHGGTVQVEKRQPRGTRVTVTLPRGAATPGAAE